ncbi:hypothetical protein [Hymenobacter sp. CRA2]|uniref:hypothetical protein n=1 Tax=Hymenobacter sp. CRA2 TaxID=1955620 RepID=UPI0011167609|nr:hypothetical protein [Hymenobacter sp. CRA2]
MSAQTLLSSAIRNVEGHYHTFAGMNSIFEEAERVYAYELYHQLRCLTSKGDIYSAFRIDGEINKALIDQIENYGLVESHELPRRSFCPDIVMHRAQNTREESGQFLIIEMKRNHGLSQRKIQIDILKLLHYIKSLNFQLGAFVVFNVINAEECKNSIVNAMQHIQGVPITFASKLWVYLTNTNNEIHEEFTLHSIIPPHLVRV